MPNDDVALGLAGLQEWSEPIIFDRLLEAYRRRVGVGAPSWTLARLHTLAWKAAIDTGGISVVRGLRHLLGATVPTIA